MLKPKYLIASVSLLVAGCYNGTTMADAGTDSGSATDGNGDGPTAGDGESGQPEDPPAEVDLVPESVSRRLSRNELDNTLRDLIGDDTRPARSFIAEDEFAPYDNDYTLQMSSQALVECKQRRVAADHRALAQSRFNCSLRIVGPRRPPDGVT